MKLMIIRIVSMHFTEDGVEKFLEIFQTHKHSAIRNVEGCSHLQLLKDVNDPLCLYHAKSLGKSRRPGRITENQNYLTVSGAGLKGCSQGVHRHFRWRNL